MTGSYRCCCHLLVRLARLVRLAHHKAMGKRPKKVGVGFGSLACLAVSGLYVRVSYRLF